MGAKNPACLLVALAVLLAVSCIAEARVAKEQQPLAHPAPASSRSLLRTKAPGRDARFAASSAAAEGPLEDLKAKCSHCTDEALDGWVLGQPYHECQKTSNPNAAWGEDYLTHNYWVVKQRKKERANAKALNQAIDLGHKAKKVPVPELYDVINCAAAAAAAKPAKPAPQAPKGFKDSGYLYPHERGAEDIKHGCKTSECWCVSLSEKNEYCQDPQTGAWYGCEKDECHKAEDCPGLGYWCKDDATEDHPNKMVKAANKVYKHKHKDVDANWDVKICSGNSELVGPYPCDD